MNDVESYFSIDITSMPFNIAQACFRTDKNFTEKFSIHWERDAIRRSGIVKKFFVKLADTFLCYKIDIESSAGDTFSSENRGYNRTDP